ncbi:MAG: response regulator [Pleurocapsa sp.]
MSMKYTKPITILVVEDCHSDIELITKVFNRTSISHKLQVVRDGAMATAYLNQEGDYSDALRPNVILLDLYLPKKTGLQVLAEIKSNPQLCRIPVIVLTSSDLPQDVLSCYRMNANSFIKKPKNIEDFKSIIAIIEDFWLNYVILPTN